MSKRSFRSSVAIRASRQYGRGALRLAAAAALVAAPVARAGNYYWTGNHDNNWNTIGGAAGTNWSSSSVFNQNTQPNLPGSSDSVFFVLAGAGNLNTVLGQSFSINSLNFTPDAIAADTITIGNGGVTANTLTIGSGGLTDNGAATITLSANVTVGTTETLGQQFDDRLQCQRRPPGRLKPDPGRNRRDHRDRHGSIFLQRRQHLFRPDLAPQRPNQPILGGNGSLANVANATAGITLNGGSSLILDNSSDGNNPGTVNSSTRLASTVGITSLGGNVNLLGSSNASTSQVVGTLSIGSGATYVTVTPGNGQTAALTFGAAGGMRVSAASPAGPSPSPRRARSTRPT